MQCVNPITLTSKAGGEYSVPCGKCIGCRSARSKEWAQRLLNEMQFSKKESFVTLTYADEYLPKDGSVHKEELTGFMKRLREHYPYGSIKYFACGEYGDESHTFRPHYHAIIFGMGPEDVKIVRKCWQEKGQEKGRISSDPVFPGAIFYVTGYVRKKIIDEYIRYKRRGVEYPFQLQSKALGLTWALKNYEILKNHGLTREGNPISIPRYYIKKLDLSGDLDYSGIIEKLEKRDKTLLDKGFTQLQIIDWLAEMDKQRKKNLMAKERMFH